MPSRMKALLGSSFSSLRHRSKWLVTGAVGTVGSVRGTLLTFGTPVACGPGILKLAGVGACPPAAAGDAIFPALFPVGGVVAACLAPGVSSGTLLCLVGSVVKPGRGLVVMIPMLVGRVWSSAVVHGAYVGVSAFVAKVASLIEVV